MRNFVFVLFQVLPFSVNCQANKIHAETYIENVTIYFSGARVERSSTVNVRPGRSEIYFEGLSNRLDQQTVQLKAEANITLLAVQTTKDFLGEHKIQDEEKELTDKTEVLKDKLNLDQKLLEVYKNDEAMLIKNQVIGGTAGSQTPKSNWFFTNL
ncbi:MAG TPA: DUF4140 domain-containing protein [Puia sp.]|nr:DUF4140 domain-containing protein [Puia sp.]